MVEYSDVCTFRVSLVELLKILLNLGIKTEEVQKFHFSVLGRLKHLEM